MSSSILHNSEDAFNGGGTFERASFTANPSELNSGMSEIPGSNGVELTSVGTTVVATQSDQSDNVHLINYDEGQTSEDVEEKSGYGKASYNMINSIIGAGIIGLPFAVAQAGFILGVILLFFMAVITDYSLRLLVETGLIVGITSYQGVMDKMFGKIGFYSLSLCQFFYPFFAMIGYTIIVGDTIPAVLKEAGAGGVLINDEFIKFAVTVLVMWPISLYRNISKLGKVSFLAILFIIFLGIVVLIRVNNGSTSTYDAPPFQLFNYHIAESLSIMTFAYMCHHNTFLIYNSLAQASLKRYSNVVHVSVFAAAIIAFILSLGGYITFRSSIRGDLLENYCVHDTLVNVARVGYAFVVMFTFPIEMFVCREVLSIGWSWYSKVGAKAQSMTFHIFSTLTVGAVILGIGVPVSKLSVVLELSGALFGTPLAFIFPPACYLRATRGQGYNRQRIQAGVCLVFGVVLAIMGTIVAIIQAAEGVTEETPEWEYCCPNNNCTTAMDGNFTTAPMPTTTPVTAS